MAQSELKQLLLVSCALTLLIASSHTSRAENSSNSPSPSPGIGVISVGQSHPLARAFLGANIEGAYSPSGTYQWTDPKTLSAVKALGIQSLRYPGGTAANYWDWHSGWVYKGFPTGAGPFSETLKDFAPLVKVTGPPMFDLNVMTYNNAIATPDQTGAMVQDQIAMLKTAQQLGMPVEYIELGNELYFAVNPTNADSRNYAQRFASGAAYANEMNEWIKALKSSFPQAQIAVIGQAFQGGNWNADVLSNLKGADAVTLHYYQTQSAGGEDPTSILSKAFTKWTYFRSTQIQPVASKNMSVWITEFDFIDHTSDLEYANTWLHGLFDAEMFVQFLSEPAITTVDIYNFHSQSKRSSLIYDGTEKFGTRGALGAQSGTLSASGQVVSIFGRALSGASSVASLNLSGLAPVSSGVGGAKFTPFPPVSGVAINYGTAGGTGLILVNLSPQPIALSYGSGTAQLQSVSAPSLGTSVVAMASVASNAKQISLEQFEIPPFSVSYVRK